MSFKDKVCVVTGGANGIGLSIVREFARLGAKLAIIDIDKQAGEKLLNEIKGMGSDVLFFLGDIAFEDTLKAFTAKVIETYGRVDYLINNACISRKGIKSGCSFDDFNY
ncbi:MAG TPA: SDR family NAD(P)-dependent oxidoreductase, partial [Clostridia bacterium]